MTNEATRACLLSKGRDLKPTEVSAIAKEIQRLEVRLMLPSFGPRKNSAEDARKCSHHSLVTRFPPNSSHRNCLRDARTYAYSINTLRDGAWLWLVHLAPLLSVLTGTGETIKAARGSPQRIAKTGRKRQRASVLLLFPSVLRHHGCIHRTLPRFHHGVCQLLLHWHQ